jgi:polyisoprenoid-binding protein YceI
MRSTIPSLALLALVGVSPALAAETYTIDKAHSEASFQVRHLGISNVRGRFADFDGAISIDRAKPESSSVEFTIKAASIDTGSPDRDKHLRTADFFDVEKFPTITFKSTKVVPKGGSNYDVTGTLTMHGVSKEVTIPVVHLGFVKDPWGNDKAGFELNTTLNRKDFGLTWNKALETGGLLVGEEVKVSINLETALKKEAAAK